jgi:hypothetical protein
MEKLLEQVKKELTEMGTKGINAGNLEVIDKLVDIYKDLGEIKKMEEGGQQMQEYSRYRESGGGYREGYRDGYNDSGSSGGSGSGGYGNYGEYNEYGRRGVPGSGRGRSYSARMRDHMDRMIDGMDQYEYGKDRYMHSGDDSRVVEGLEKLMYAMCMFVESAMDFAETPQEKEIIRKHIQKIKHL